MNFDTDMCFGHIIFKRFHNGHLIIGHFAGRRCQIVKNFFRDSQNREISSLRTRNIEIESEVDRLKRQLTNERFERERAVQELRRHGLAAPVDTGRLSRLSAGSPSRCGIWKTKICYFVTRSRFYLQDQAWEQ